MPTSMLVWQDIHHVRHEMGCKRLCSLLRNSVLRLRLFRFQNLENESVFVFGAG
jgi:hypothetical protein